MGKREGCSAETGRPGRPVWTPDPTMIGEVTPQSRAIGDGCTPARHHPIAIARG